MALALIFAVPMMVAAALVSSTGLHDLVRGLIIFSGISLVISPISAWRVHLTEFAFPSSGGSRLVAVFRFWLSGALILGAMFNLFYAMLGYSPARPGPSPRVGFLIADFTICMFLSLGVLGAFAPIFGQEFVIRCGIITGLLSSLAVAVLGLGLFG